MGEEEKQGKKFRSLTAKVNFIIVLSLFWGSEPSPPISA
jgi:hypothetical protein